MTRWLLLAALLCAAPLRALSAGTLYAGPVTDPAFTVIAPRLLTEFFPDQRLDAAATADSTAALAKMAADPGSAALADLATMLDYIEQNKLPPTQLEFHGPIGTHCLVAFVQRDGWVSAFQDLASANGTPRPAVGLAGPDADGLFRILRRREPGLANIDVEPGSADDLAARVGRGMPDMLLLVTEPGSSQALLERLADNDRLTVLPVVTRRLQRTGSDRDSGFVMMPVRLDSGLTPWSSRPLLTLCSPFGVVLRSNAPAALRDAVNRAVPAVAAAVKPTLTDRAGTAATKTLDDTLDALHGLLHQFRLN